MTDDEHGGPIQHRPRSTIDISRFIHSRRPELIRQLCSSERLTSRPAPSKPKDNSACDNCPLPHQNSTKWRFLTCGRSLIAKALSQTRASFLDNYATPFKFGYKVSRRPGQIREALPLPTQLSCWRNWSNVETRNSDIAAHLPMLSRAQNTSQNLKTFDNNIQIYSNFEFLSMCQGVCVCVCNHSQVIRPSERRIDSCSHTGESKGLRDFFRKIHCATSCPDGGTSSFVTHVLFFCLFCTGCGWFNPIP